MKRKTILIFSLIVLLIFVGLLALSSQNNGVSRDGSIDTVTETTLDAAPSFSLEDYDGNTVTLADFDGTVRVVNSWATWCPFCVNELPDFVELQKEFGDEVVVIAIDRRESLETAKNFTDSLGISSDLVYLLDPSDSFYQSIGGFSMPETLFINSDGDITFHKRGFMTLDEMRTRTREALGN